ncbi:MAG TPA: aldo/keto reductase [Tetragenococcus sp.]|nr:aldo/keto reductase [Tetragenococcus sp.]
MRTRIAQRTLFPIGLGTWHMGDDAAKRKAELKALRTGIETGAEVIDTAEMYGEGNSGSLVGEAIRPFAREELFLISKVYPWNAGEKDLPLSLDNSLRRLQTDYLDLYLLHWTGNIPVAETIEAMEKAKNAGKIKAWGVSNFDVSDLSDMYEAAQGQYCAANEVLYNLGQRGIEFDLLPYMQERKLPLIAYAPIAQGDQLGTHLLAKSSLLEVAQNHQATAFQILLAWSIRNGQTIAIPQTSSEKHVMENLQAAEIKLTPAEEELLDKDFPKPMKKQPLAII